MNSSRSPHEAVLLEGMRLLRGVSIRARWQWLLWILLWLALGAVLIFMQWGERASIVRQQTDQLLTQNRVAAQLLRTQVQTANAALVTVQKHLAPLLRHGGGDTQVATTHLRSFVDMLPAVRALSVLDETGLLVLSSRDGFVGENFAHRAYFQAVIRSKSATTIYVSEPFRGASNAWAVNISRGLFDDSGRFRGVVVATLDPEYFLLWIRSLRYADDVVISLAHESGRLYVASDHSAIAELMEQSNFTSSLFRLHLDSGRRDTVVAEPDPSSGAELLLKVASTITLRNLDADNDFVVVATRSQSRFLSEWRSETLGMALIFGTLMALTGAALVIYQRWVQQVRSQVQRASDELVKMAYHDPLTGAFNRRAFLNALELELERARRSGGSACLLMLDIDHFKLVNDKYGHDFGDLVLQHLVNVLQSRLRRIDMLGRLGGEEFAIVLPSTELAGALELAERLRVAVELSEISFSDETEPDPNLREKTVPVTISIGVTAIQPLDKDETIHLALKRSDQAMYAAKRAGRNRVCSV